MSLTSDLIKKIKLFLRRHEALYLFAICLLGRVKRLLHWHRVLKCRKRGGELFNQIKTKYGNEKKYYFTMSHLGEMVAGLYYVGADNGRNNIVVIAFKTVKPIKRLYENSGITFHVIEFDYDRECLYEFAMKKGSPLCSFTTASLTDKHPFRFYKQNFFKSYREYLEGHSPMDAESLEPEFKPDASFSVENLGFKVSNKTVYICPYSNSRISPDMERFFQAFIDDLVVDGYECVCLLGTPTHEGLKNCHNVFLKFNDLGWLLKQGGVLVAYRSGLCDVLLFAKTPMVCVYDKKMYYALKGYRLDEDEPRHINPYVEEVRCDFISEDAVGLVKSAALKVLEIHG